MKSKSTKPQGANISAKKFSIRAIAPSVVTLMAFTSGLTAIRFALAGKWELAVAAIILAGIFDGLDGTVARLLKSTSRFGAELDSLSDVVSFGVAPAVVIYLWSLQSLDRLGWALALIYAIAMALRLARFNSHLEDEGDEPKIKMGFLTGIPAPMGAGLISLPMVISFAFETTVVRDYPVIIGLYMMVITVLMVSTLPTPSLKAARVPKQSFVPLMLMIGIFFAILFVYSWQVLLGIGFIYLFSLPICWVSYQRQLKQLDDE